jgi:ABC-type nitrate/sulfonate/bicarbonate transport system substrate-binding protein
LSDDRLDLLARQADFLYAHGFLERPVDVRAWASHEPLRAARETLAQSRVAAV